MFWLDVPYAEKDDAKAAGARWDPVQKRWFSPQDWAPTLERWRALAELPVLLPGEDRTFGDGLFVDLVPKTCWFTNVRSCVSQRDWERIRRMMVGRAGHRCEVCGATEDRDTKRWLEAHERWSFDTQTATQTLRRLILLCTLCHRATHYGFAQVSGTETMARAQLLHVNGWTPTELDGHIRAAFTLWNERNTMFWDLDLSILESTGILITAPPAATDRATVAAATLSPDMVNTVTASASPSGSASSAAEVAPMLTWNAPQLSPLVRASPRWRSTAGLVLGIVSLVVGGIVLVPIVGLRLSVLGIRRERPWRRRAVAGIVLNSIALAAWVPALFGLGIFGIRF